jgi:hypothetical protein
MLRGAERETEPTGAATPNDRSLPYPVLERALDAGIERVNAIQRQGLR